MNDERWIAAARLMQRHGAFGTEAELAALLRTVVIHGDPTAPVDFMTALRASAVESARQAAVSSGQVLSPAMAQQVADAAMMRRLTGGKTPPQPKRQPG